VVTVTPRLVVDGAASAIEWYESVLGAHVGDRYEDSNGKVVHAELTVGGSRVTLKDADTTDPSPRSLGGTAVLLMLASDDVDALGERMVEAGGEVIFPIGDHEDGRGGRVRDPFGHAWMISQQ
jgi:PhnB protein